MRSLTQAHGAGLLVTAHGHPLTAIRDAVAAGVDAIEHGTFATETGIEVPDTIVASLVESAIPVCPTLGKAWGVVLTPASLEFLRKTADALASATALAAKACGVADRKGRLVADFDADLLLVEGDPLTDITALRNPAAVYLRGHRAT